MTEIYVFLITQVIVAIGTVATLKTDSRWIKQWCEKHELNDQQRFRELQDEDRRIEREGREDYHQLRNETLVDMQKDINSVSGRVSMLEGSQR